jgi:hypothetical protein
MKTIFVMLFVFAAAPAFSADTNHGKCRAEVLARDSWWGSQIKLLARTGQVEVKTWTTKSNEPAFGPTIYSHMWYSVKNGKMVAQVCARCFRDRIQDDDAGQDGGGFEYIKNSVRCDLDENYH